MAEDIGIDFIRMIFIAEKATQLSFIQSKVIGLRSVLALGRFFIRLNVCGKFLHFYFSYRGGNAA